MTIRQVLLDGVGTDGDGTTWNDNSDATSAYIGMAGLANAIGDSTLGDIIYYKGNDTGTAQLVLMGPDTAAAYLNPIQGMGCKSTTTNNQGAIVQSDLIPGQRTGAPDIDTGVTALSVGATDTFNRAAGDFVLDGFVAGQVIDSFDFTNAANNGEFKIATVAATVLTIDESVLSVEGAGSDERITAKVFAHDDSDMPSITVTGSSRIQTGGAVDYYGLKLSVNNYFQLNITDASEYSAVFDECHLDLGSFAWLQGPDGGFHNYNNCRWIFDTQSLFIGEVTTTRFNGGEIIGNDTAAIRGSSGSAPALGSYEFNTVRFDGFDNLWDVTSFGGYCSVNRCRFSAGFGLSTGSRNLSYIIENFGSNSQSAGISTSVGTYEASQRCGEVIIETAAVRTGGADDEAGAGAYSYAMNPLAGATVPGGHGLELRRLNPIWLTAGAHTIEVYFTSASSNVRATPWDNDSAWANVQSVSESGGSRGVQFSTMVTLLGTPVAVDNDAVSVWGAGTARNQKFVLNVDAAYEGAFQVSVYFAPGANADSIFVDPDPREV